MKRGGFFVREYTFTDEQLKRAAELVVKSMMESIPDPEDCPPVQMSPEFEERMRKMFEEFGCKYPEKRSRKNAHEAILQAEEE